MLRGLLWRHPDFLKLWAGETVSQFGTQVTFLAVPTVAIGLVQTIVLGGAMSLLAALWIFLGPVIRLKEQPAPVMA